MGLHNCKRCGKLFISKGHSVCSQCVEKDQADFELIREYLLAHPYVSALELSQETGVEPAVITRFQREGRLAICEKQEGDLPSVCSQYTEKDQADYELIREYLLTHPYVSALELSQGTGVEPAVITRFQREGRLALREKQEGELLCAVCGIPVPAGQSCPGCGRKQSL
ncbi:MAG: hypothetical protein GX202_00620 [Firmicutes bacterium]|nr:hypothetical protein [Bacillota bacterium]